MANENYILVNQLAKEYGMNKSSFRRLLIRHGYVPKKLRTADSGGQWNLVIDKDEAKTIIEKRNNEYIPKSILGR